jgi:hypothetical protein
MICELSDVFEVIVIIAISMIIEVIMITEVVINDARIVIPNLASGFPPCSPVPPVVKPFSSLTTPPSSQNGRSFARARPRHDSFA